MGGLSFLLKLDVGSFARHKTLRKITKFFPAGKKEGCIIDQRAKQSD